uniref:Uncharacterized protein MANES_08G017700 n=1 Tax=Rhizophora mucronata TaxID=61149 RepID=A0A2P2NYS2_RHIMU
MQLHPESFSLLTDNGGKEILPSLEDHFEYSHTALMFEPQSCPYQMAKCRTSSQHHSSFHTLYTYQSKLLQYKHLTQNQP